MPANKPAGPRPFFIITFLAGVGLLCLGVFRPGLNTFWEAPVGFLVAWSSLGKMSAR